MTLIKVKGGTNAGHRRVVEHEPWSCRCTITEPGPERDLPNLLERRVHPGSTYSCGVCGARRP